MANIAGSSWGATPNVLGDAGGVVTWSIAGMGEALSVFSSANGGTSVNPAAFLNIDFEALLQQAFADWSSFGNIEFLQLEDPGGDAGEVLSPDIRIFFGEVPGSTLGTAYFPTFGSPALAVAGDILLDVGQGLSNNADLFIGLALHEIGHALGLEHVPNGSQSIMTPTLSQSSLQPDDIAGIREIYGTQDNATPVYTMPGNMTNLDMVNAPGGMVINGSGAGNRIDGTNTGDRINGGGGNDTLLGQNGADLLDGGNAQDRLFGGNGNDTLRGGPGFDRLEGGSGNDSLIGGGNADNLFGGTGNDTLLGQSGLDRLFGGAGNDIGRGGDGNDGLFGETGNDRLFGEGGRDRFFGGVGNDWLDGGAGSDTLNGGAGFDTLNGGTGNDRLQGDFNADRFVFANGHGDDVITDFDAFNRFEKIDLSAVSAITSLNDLRDNHMTQQGGNVVIDTGGGNSITLNGVSMNDLDASDFLF